MSVPVRLAVVGATGAVGRTVLRLLHERSFPLASLRTLASERSVGLMLEFGDEEVDVENLADFDFAEADIAIFSAGGALARRLAPAAAEAGCTVIDNSSAFRYDDDIPLIVPEVNADALQASHRIIANPNCSTAQLVLPLKVLDQLYGLESVDLATYQSVSGAGQSGIDELEGQVVSLLGSGVLDEPEIFPRQIAFNILPQIGELDENGYCLEEIKMVRELRKILDRPELEVNPTCVRVPVFHSHGEAVTLRTREPVDIAEVNDLLDRTPGIRVCADPCDATVLDSTDIDPVLVSRIRPLLNSGLGLCLWVVADNLRKGAALNAVQIAEQVVKHRGA